MACHMPTLPLIKKNKRRTKGTAMTHAVEMEQKYEGEGGIVGTEKS